MQRSEGQVLTLPDGVRVLVLRDTTDWRAETATRLLLQITAAAATPEHRIPAEQRGRLISELLMPGRFIVGGDVGGRRTALGVSASHEGRDTFVACSAGPVVIDACAVYRWPEIQGAATVAFTWDERHVLRHPWDWCRAWTALECRAKRQGTSLLARTPREPLLHPTSTGDLYFGDVWHVNHPPSATSVRNRICLGIMSSPPRPTRPRA